MPAPHRNAKAPSSPAWALVLATVPALLVTGVTAVVLIAAKTASPWPLYALALLANLGLWFGFAPPYLVGWVDFWDPGARARVGRLGVIALAGVLWFYNLFLYALSGTALGALLRG